MADLDQIAALYELLPWQRELLEAMMRRDEYDRAEKASYRAEVEAEYERICQWLTEKLDLPEGVKVTWDNTD